MEIVTIVVIAALGALFSNAPSAIHNPSGYEAHSCLAGIGGSIVIGFMVFLIKGCS